MQKRLWTPAALLTLSGILASCGYVSQYERQVYDWEPVYCYKSLAAMQCFKEPRFADERRLVNYYGPDPGRYDRPDDPDVPELQAPREIDYWVKDAEPVPEAAPVKVKAAAEPGPTSPGETLLPDSRSEGLSFLDRLLAPLLGKPKLAHAAAKTPVVVKDTDPVNKAQTL